MTLERDMAGVFDLGDGIRDVRAHGQGLINDTFLVITDSGRNVILQRINRHVFPEPARIMANLRVLAEHVRKRQAGEGCARELRLPGIIPARDGKDFAIDPQGGFWRAMHFLDNTITLTAITGKAQAEETGFALGRFHALTHDIDPARMHETLPGFHNAPAYFARFLRASARPRAPAASRDLLYCLDFVETRRGLTRVLETARREGRLRTRVIHGDTKLNNFLFDADTGRAISLIDLDTVQPGLIHYDIGDCLRSCANPAGECPGDPASARLDLDIGEAILDRYFAETRGFLTRGDRDYIYDAIHLIPFELGLRFFTDHLEGDHYFKTDRPGQNLHRAMTQFALTLSVEKHEGKIRSLIGKL